MRFNHAIRNHSRVDARPHSQLSVAPCESPHLTIGTNGVAYAVSERYTPEPDGCLHTFGEPMPETWMHMGVMFSAAGGLRWLHDTLAPDGSYDTLNRHAESVHQGAQGCCSRLA